MKGHFRGVPAIALAAWSLASCNVAHRNVAAPAPEAEQVIGETMKELYMAASAAAPRSAAQQKIILKMVQRASNGKELLLAMRAAIGVFPAEGGPQEHQAENQVQSIVTAKMMELATLYQLIDYEKQYSVDPASARQFVQRMFQLAQMGSEAGDWYRIRAAAFRMKVSDLERQAQATGDQLAGR
jgi:hypothetical protein